MPPPAKPQIKLFTATPDVVQQGAAVTLKWSSVNGRGATLEGQQCALSGTMVVRPNATKVYTLIVSGKGSNATAQVTVTVVEIVVPPITISAEVFEPMLMVDTVSAVSVSPPAGVVVQAALVELMDVLNTVSATLVLLPIGAVVKAELIEPMSVKDVVAAV
jgi:hypothetical protein